jgi:MipA family protein
MRWLFLLLASLPGLVLADYSMIGAGLRTRPEYDGSSERTIDVIPVLRYYGKPWFARTTQGILEGGARWTLRRNLDAGVLAAYEQGPRDKDPGASVGFYVEGDRDIGRVPLNGLIRVRQHVDTDRGLEVDTRATVGVYGSHGILAGVFLQATWATQKKFREYYGVDDSGLLFTSLGLLGSYEITSRWMLVASLEHRRLSDDAARSPIVDKRSGIYASTGLGYRF